jgi:Fic family protein
MHSLSEKYLKSIAFSSEQAATLRAIGEYQGKQALYAKQSPEALKSLQEVAVIESSESSNRLEGIIVPHKRIEQLVLHTTKPKNRSEQEVAGYRDALALLHESAKHMAFTPNVILQLHSLVCRYMPNQGGRWKISDNEIIERYPDGSRRIRFKPTPAHLTPIAMEDLSKNYKNAIEVVHTDPLIVLSLAVLDFLCIHPFTDGNGRVSRLLTLLLMYHFDYQVGRYISLERIFEETKESYYETLEASSQGWHEGNHDAKPWLNYFWGVLLRAYREFEGRVGNIKPGRGSKTDQIKSFTERQTAAFAISDIEAEFPWISRDMIRIVLRQLRDEKFIKPQGKGRGAKWIRK